MRIECPSCATSYEIADPAIGTKGRKLRCGKCAEVWHIAPPEPEPAAAEPPVEAAEEDVGGNAFAAFRREFAEEEPENEGEDDPVAADFQAPRPDDAEEEPSRPAVSRMNLLAGLDAASLAREGIKGIADGEDEIVFEKPKSASRESLATIEANVASALAKANEARSIEVTAESRARRGGRVRQSFAKGGRGRKALGALTLAASVAIVAGVIALRYPIVRAVPDLASLYAAIGLEVNLRGLAFRDIRMLRDEAGGNQAFVVEGLIENVSGRTVQLPQVLLSLRDDSASELYSWTTRLSLTALPPGEVTRFKTELTSAPAIASDIMVRFDDRPMRRAGL